jgi:TolA-binding protein
MDTEADQALDLDQLMDWVQVNRKAVITVVAIIAVIGAIIGLVMWNHNHKEMAANEALSAAKSPTGQTVPTTELAEPYLKVADDYSGTQAAARALLIGGGILFDAGKFDQSQATFEKFLQQYPDSPLANEALMGVASSLEAAGKTADAAAKYEDLMKHHQAEAILPQIKSALARCDVALNKPDQALRLYLELAQSRANDTWSAEAQIQYGELLAKHPELNKPAPTATPMSSSPFALPSPSHAPSATPAATAPAPAK